MVRLSPPHFIAPWDWASILLMFRLSPSFSAPQSIFYRECVKPYFTTSSPYVDGTCSMTRVSGMTAQMELWVDTPTVRSTSQRSAPHYLKVYKHQLPRQLDLYHQSNLSFGWEWKRYKSLTRIGIQFFWHRTSLYPPTYLQSFSPSLQSLTVDKELVRRSRSICPSFKNLTGQIYNYWDAFCSSYAINFLTDE